MPGGPGGPIPGVNIPFTEEWFKAQKKLMKESGMTEAAEGSSDVYTPSAAAQKLPSTKDEKFLASVKPEIMALDPDSETFLPEATEKLVGSVIEQEYGEHASRNPGYPQMQEKITRTILDNPDYRERMADFLDILLMTRPHQDEGAVQPDPPAGGGSQQQGL